MRQLKACGVLCFRQRPQKQFLLMLRRPRGYDLPKGHMEPGETELACALRELEEETGITAAQITIDPDFRFETNYTARYTYLDNEKIAKTVVIFLGELHQDVDVQTTEHKSFAWFDWRPGLEIQKRTIDGLLREVETFWGEG